MSSAFKNWTVIFPGKMAICWKPHWGNQFIGSKEDAEEKASQFCNTVAIPLQLWEHIDRLQKEAKLETLLMVGKPIDD